MKKTQKILALLLTVCLVCVMFSACGKDNTASGDETVVTVWSGDTHAKAVYDRLINEYNETTGKEKGVKIDFQFKGGDTIGKMVELALQSGDAPEMFTSAGGLEKSIEMGYLAAIDDLPGGADLIEPLKEYLVEGSTTLDGKTYLLPYAATTRGLIYNKDMFKAAGIVDEKGEPKAPETLAELREVAKKLTDTSKNQFGIIFPMKWGNWFASDIYALKQSATGFTDFNYETGEYDLTGLDKIMEVFLGIKKDGSFYPGAESIDNDTARAHFAEGNIGMKFAFSFDVGVLNDQFPAKCDWGVAPLPVLDKNEKYMQRMTMNSTPYINSAVLNDSKKAEAVAEVLRFLTSDEFLTEIYISGINIPIRSDVIEKADESKIDRKGWVDFANMVAISKLLQPTPKKQGIVKKSITDRFIQDVWTGKMSPKQMIDEVDAETEEQREAYLKKDPSDKTENYIIPDWIQKR